jgi:translation initiation factor eIF-2B subunit alpha
MQLEQELRACIAFLKNNTSADLGGRTNISLGSGCDLFMKYVTRAFTMDSSDFTGCKEELLRRGEKFTTMSLSARAQIAEWGHSFIQDGSTVLIHGMSRVVTTLLLKAAETRAFKLIVTEGRPGFIRLVIVKYVVRLRSRCSDAPSFMYS